MLVGLGREVVCAQVGRGDDGREKFFSSFAKKYSFQGDFCPERKQREMT